MKSTPHFLPGSIFFLIAGICLLMSGCAAQNVYFNKVIHDRPMGPSARHGERLSVIRSYQDEDGDFYPDKVQDPQNVGLDVEWKRAGSEKWDALQGKRAVDKAEQIAASLLNAPLAGRPRPLVILIHGFNVRNAEPSYAFAKDKIDEYLNGTEDPVYWQVHWDGHEITWNRPLFAWGKAQGTGPLAGLKLRRVLNRVLELAPDTPVRILTHSSGAFIAASLLGNNTSALKLAQAKPCPGNYVLFCKEIAASSGEYRVPQSSDIRVAMLAPATPSLSFATPGRSSGVASADCATHGLLTENMALIVGLDEADVAVTKGPLPSSASIFGSTSLGARRSEYETLKDALTGLAACKENPRTITSYPVDFENSKTYNERSKLFWDSHDFSVYLQREGILELFDRLFNRRTAQK